MAIPAAPHMAFAVGILGNIVSFLVYLAPLPTFYRIYKKKSTEEFQSIPYAVALFSAMLLLYYGFLKTNGLMIITINTIGCAMEATYLILFMLYATKEAKIYTTKMLIFFNVGVYGLIILCTSLFSHGKMRVTIVGWICAIFSVSNFAAPLGIMTLVIRTKSVEYMPFALSFFLTLCAIMWFFYGFLIKDFYIATPNILGFVFGIAQMVLYMIYKENKNQVLPEVKLQDLATTVINLSTIMEMQENFKAGTYHVQEEHAVNEEANNKPVEESESNV
ncbi:Bidirectional sugar transporter like [Actinidia chinensis var. chinensis]|uniref:Bidirectional sugar transporter SWEET n=1 Tax=Actinidia chinensis var. chinensis TaxID=1590841 RepID=A0A2R6QE86_ACTCC|nr:Bidirectional sugar transporter like [Actinidia chinensis var. chinensis]